MLLNIQTHAKLFTKITRLIFIELHHDSTLTNLLLFDNKGKMSHLSIIGDGMYNTPFPPRTLYNLPCLKTYFLFHSVCVGLENFQRKFARC